MSLQTKLSDLITAIGTDYKQLRTWITGTSTGSLTGLTTTTKASLLDAINEVNAKEVPEPSAATETVAGIIEIATQTETNTGTIDTHAITPLKLKNHLAPVATSGSASDITTGTLPSSVLPPLAITDTFVINSEADMLALVAERGDVAVRTDLGRSLILTAEPPSTLSNWTELTAGGDVSSVAGRTGAVVLSKSDVDLANVDNTSDADKPVSTAQANADNLRLLKSSNLADLENLGTARTNLSVYSQAQLGNPETDLAALYATAKA